MRITIDIPDAVVASHKAAFFREHPVDKDSEGQPLFTEIEWFKEVLRRFIVHSYRRGSQRLAEDAVVFDDSVITVT